MVATLFTEPGAAQPGSTEQLNEQRARFRTYLGKVGSGEHTSSGLSREEAAEAMELMLDGIATPAQIGAFLAQTGADELMLVSSIFDHEQRLKSYELGAIAMQNLAQADEPKRAAR